MVDLREHLSEFSYGYGITSEVETALRGIGLGVVPFLPSLIHEKKLGFDVAFDKKGAVLVLQFKLGEQLSRFRPSKDEPKTLPLARPFWRFRVDTSHHQFDLLRNWEQEGAEAYYVAPRFADWEEYADLFQKEELLLQSLLLTPSEIERGISAQDGKAGRHSVAYDENKVVICSQPTELRGQPSRELASRVLSQVLAAHDTLEDRVQRIVARSRASEVSGLPFRRFDLVDRASRAVDAIAAEVAVEAWSQGAQTFFVSEPIVSEG